MRKPLKEAPFVTGTFKQYVEEKRLFGGFSELDEGSMNFADFAGNVLRQRPFRNLDKKLINFLGGIVKFS